MKWIWFVLFFSLLVPGAWSASNEGGVSSSDVFDSGPDRHFYIRAFGGEIGFPFGVNFDSRSVHDGRLIFRNLGVFDGVELPEFFVVVSVGSMDDSTMKQIEGASHRFSCYGFHQAVDVAEAADGAPISSAVLFDEEIYVSITSDNPDLWIEALSGFSERYGDSEASCLRGD